MTRYRIEKTPEGEFVIKIKGLFRWSRVGFQQGSLFIESKFQSVESAERHALKLLIPKNNTTVKEGVA